MRFDGCADYPGRLATAWARASAPRGVSAPTVISLFAGCGGSALGYRMAGFEEVLAVEWDGYAVATFRANFAETPVYEGDVAALSGEECLRLAGLSAGELDVLDGSPPCQCFSVAGSRKMDVARDNLFWEFIRLLRALRPKIFVAENVKGLVFGKMKKIFAEILGEMRASGYVVEARVVNAAALGVPQRRERVIFIGVREDLGVRPTFPSPSREKAVTVREALAGIESVGLPLKGGAAALAPVIRPGRLTLHSAKRVDRKATKFYTMRRLDWERPSWTIVKLVGQSVDALIHPDADALLTLGACKRLCSFPDEFVLPPAPFAKQWGALGNAVPPLMMEAVAGAVSRGILERRR